MVDDNTLQAYLAEWVFYDPDTGLMLWKKQRTNNIRAGDEVGSIDRHGYRYATFEKKHYHIARLAWFIMTNSWPTEIDHIDGDKLNNRFCNLRNTTHRGNLQNLGRHRNGHLVGASYNKSRNVYYAKAQINGKRTFLGSYNTELEAHNRYIQVVGGMP